MAIEFFDIPQGSPSTNPVSQATGYCSASTVASLNTARVPGQGNNPTITDIDGYIIMVAGQIDAVLSRNGYEVPVNTASVPEAEGFLAWVNATGAAWMVEEASPNSPNLDRSKAAFDAAMDMLENSKFAIAVPADTARAQVRAPFLTWNPPEGVYDPVREGRGGWNGDGISQCGTNSRRLPMISRSLQF